MAVRGKSDTSTLLSSKLSPIALVRLACDVLFLRGHRKIRITDGPGDGGRDIHSVAPDGQKHLTQCKFHKQIGKTASSAELSELPIAMVKLGYSAGLFVTNARISPQGKREYLDNYPQLRLEFMDGDTLASHVLDTGLLKAVWFDGKAIAAINTAITFAAIVRRHSDDASILPFKFDTFPPPTPATKYLSTRYPDINFSIRAGRGNPDVFEPYRAPEPFTAEEGALPFLEVLDITAAGNVAFYKFESLSQDACRAVLLWLGDGITVRIGVPTLTPLTGENSGTKILPKIEAISIIATRHSCSEELEWFSPGDSKIWDSQSDARVSESSNIRLYSKKLDCVASYEIQSRPSAQQRGHFELMHELTLHGWQRSVFALIPNEHEWNSPEASVPTPDEKAIWPWDSRLLCGWFHWNLLGRPTGVRTAALLPDMNLWGRPSDEEEKARLDLIRNAIEKIPGAEVLDPNRARHMVALIGDDPLSIQRTIIFDTAEVVHYPAILPSPINPHARRFGFSVAWRGNPSPDLLEATTREAGEAIQRGYLNDITVERHEQYLLLTASVAPPGLDEIPSALILSDLHSFLSVLLPRIEQSKDLAGLLQRCTKEFWAKHFSINFGVSWRESLKHYVMTAPPDGDLSPIGFPPELHPRRKQ